MLPEPFDVSVQRPVHRNCLVRLEGRRYAAPVRSVDREAEVRGCAGKVQIFAGDRLLKEYPRHAPGRASIDSSFYEGEETERVLPPRSPGRIGRRLQEIYELPVEQRPLDPYAAVVEAAR